MEPAEAGEWWATVSAWTDGPARQDTLNLLADRMQEAYGWRPAEGETREAVAGQVRRATDPRARVAAPRVVPEARVVPDQGPATAAGGPAPTLDTVLSTTDERTRDTVRKQIRQLIPPGQEAETAFLAHLRAGGPGRSAAGGAPPMTAGSDRSAISRSERRRMIAVAATQGATTTIAPPARPAPHVGPQAPAPDRW